MNSRPRKSGDSLKRLAAAGRVSGPRGTRKPETFWEVRLTDRAVADVHRLFAGISAGPDAHAVVIDAVGLLALFPDKRPSVAGEVLDVGYEPIPGETLYRLRIDDECLAGRALFAFFQPVASTERGTKSPGTIVVVGFAWEAQATVEHVIARMRDRAEAVLNRKGSK